jgi:hypothetical protein
MELFRTLQLAAATAVCTAAAAQPALAGGEPKNALPFTRLAAGRSPAATVILPAAAITTARIMIAGEAKNERPFRRSVKDADAFARFLGQNRQSAASALSGEPKNLAPFTRRFGLGA